MDCLTKIKEGAEILLEYGSGALDPAKSAELERHLLDCENCRRMAQGQREVWSALDRWTPPAVSAEFNTRLYARISREDETPRWRRWLNRVTHPAVPYPVWKPAALAAACAVLVVGFVVYSPRAAEVAPPAAQATQMEGAHVDIEQVANALDEMDVLTPAPASSSAM